MLIAVAGVMYLGHTIDAVILFYRAVRGTSQRSFQTGA